MVDQDQLGVLLSDLLQSLLDLLELEVLLVEDVGQRLVVVLQVEVLVFEALLSERLALSQGAGLLYSELGHALFGLQQLELLGQF